MRTLFSPATPLFAHPQDTVATKAAEGIMLFGVFDGHGGAKASDQGPPRDFLPPKNWRAEIKVGDPPFFGTQGPRDRRNEGSRGLLLDFQGSRIFVFYFPRRIFL